MGHGRYRLWAAVASVLFHAVVLSVLAASGLYPQPHKSGPDESHRALIAHIRGVTQNPPVLARPNIKHRTDGSFVKRPAEPPDIDTLFTPIAPTDNKDPQEVKTGDYADIIWQRDNYHRQQVRFFSSTSVCRRVCFLVDCSGSMRGLMGQVRDELGRSIQSLGANQYFGIVFFGGGKVIKFGGGNLVLASESAKSQALSFIRSVQPEGRTNASAGFEAAVRMRNDQELAAEVIWFLTDGFELSSGDEYRFRQEILRLHREYLAGGAVNTIGFWPSEKDRRLLESIAYDSGGEFVCVDGEDF